MNKAELIEAMAKAADCTKTQAGAALDGFIDAVTATLKKGNKIKVRRTKYLNNMVEQDHRFIKKITKPMKGFKSFNSARSTLGGIELHHMLRKGQYRDKTVITTVWEQFYSLAA